jgi:hypothetical protein
MLREGHFSRIFSRIWIDRHGGRELVLLMHEANRVAIRVESQETTPRLVLKTWFPQTDETQNANLAATLLAKNANPEAGVERGPDDQFHILVAGPRGKPKVERLRAALITLGLLW